MTPPSQNSIINQDIGQKLVTDICPQTSKNIMVASDINIMALLKDELCDRTGAIREDVFGKTCAMVPRLLVKTTPLGREAQEIEILCSDKQYTIGRVKSDGLNSFTFMRNISAEATIHKTKKSPHNTYMIASPYFNQATKTKKEIEAYNQVLSHITELLSKEHRAATPAGARLQLNPEFSISYDDLEKLLYRNGNYEALSAIQAFYNINTKTSENDVEARANNLAQAIGELTIGLQILLYDAIVHRKVANDTEADLDLRLFSLYFCVGFDTHITTKTHETLESRLLAYAKDGRFVVDAHNLNTRLIDHIALMRKTPRPSRPVQLLVVKQIPANPEGYGVLVDLMSKRDTSPYSAITDLAATDTIEAYTATAAAEAPKGLYSAEDTKDLHQDQAIFKAALPIDFRTKMEKTTKK